VTDTPVRRPAPLDPTVDFPSRIDELLYWLRRAGLEPAVRWSDDDLVVIVARKGTLTDATPVEATVSEQPALHR
jgi:hypothetical protein